MQGSSEETIAPLPNQTASLMGLHQDEECPSLASSLNASRGSAAWWAEPDGHRARVTVSTSVTRLDDGGVGWADLPDPRPYVIQDRLKPQVT